MWKEKEATVPILCEMDGNFIELNCENLEGSAEIKNENWQVGHYLHLKNRSLDNALEVIEV